MGKTSPLRTRETMGHSGDSHRPPELLQCQQAFHRHLGQAILLTALGLLTLAAVQWLPTHHFLSTEQDVGSPGLLSLPQALLLLLPGLSASGISFWRWTQLRGYAGVVEALRRVLAIHDLADARHALAIACEQAGKSALKKSALRTLQTELDQHLNRLTRQRLQQRLAAEAASARGHYHNKLQAIRSRMPLVQAETNLRETLDRLRTRRKELAQQWAATYETFSWWNKLKYPATPDFKELDRAVDQLKLMHAVLLARHGEDFTRLDQHLSVLRMRAEARIATGVQQIEQFIAQEVTDKQATEVPLLGGLVFAALSVPFSLWDDVTRAGHIYDVLRSVNGNYAGMSDGEIWLQTLFMPPERLAGLASLTKGAYFEQLVATDTGGALFEHFNNPGTDIVIDGVAYQLKATSSAAYIQSVDADIPVIATSEIAEQTRAIDSGLSNIELEHSVDLAFGGLVDTKDTAIDALLSGVGGIGLFATIKGINHAAKRYENGGDGVEALFSGAGVAIEGTARALVGTAELGYKVLASAPSRFMGRTLLRGLKKLDDKMMEAARKAK